MVEDDNLYNPMVVNNALHQPDAPPADSTVRFHYYIKSYLSSISVDFIILGFGFGRFERRVGFKDFNLVR